MTRIIYSGATGWSLFFTFVPISRKEFMSVRLLYKFTLISLINFLIAACMGFILRYAFIGETSFNYNHLLHTHSHVAALGWAYQIVCTLIVFTFVKDHFVFYKRLFWLTQISVVGMMLSFPFQGYGSVSIPFSSLHIICSYVFAIFVWKSTIFNSQSEKLILRAALIFLVISTLGIWMLGPAIAIHGKNSVLYQVAIQFYLHFQFSGWFIFAVLALLLRYFSGRISLNLPEKTTRLLVHCFIATVPVGFALVLYWFFKNNVWFILNMAAVLAQLFILLFFLTKWKELIGFISRQIPTVKWLFTIGFLSLVLKIIFQAATVIPQVARLSQQVRNFSVGYIHLIMLGFFTGIIFALLYSLLKNKISLVGRLGVLLFISGFFITEFFLFLQGLFYVSGFGQLNYYSEILLTASGVLVISIGFILYDFVKDYHQFSSAEDKQKTIKPIH